MATPFKPRAEFVAAVREILEALPHAGDDCPLCGCEASVMHADTCPAGRLGRLMEWYTPRFVESVEPRREAVLPIDLAHLDLMLHSGGRIALYCTDLPADAHVVGVDTSDNFDAFLRGEPLRLIIHSASFEPVLPPERANLVGVGVYRHTVPHDGPTAQEP